MVSFHPGMLFSMFHAYFSPIIFLKKGRRGLMREVLYLGIIAPDRCLTKGHRSIGAPNRYFAVGSNCLSMWSDFS